MLALLELGSVHAPADDVAPYAQSHSNVMRVWPPKKSCRSRLLRWHSKQAMELILRGPGTLPSCSYAPQSPHLSQQARHSDRCTARAAAQLQYGTINRSRQLRKKARLGLDSQNTRGRGVPVKCESTGNGKPCLKCIKYPCRAAEV